MKVLDEILRARGLGEPDGQPLYAYRVSDEELRRLTTELRTRMIARPDFDTHAAAAFCLIAAEHLSRGDGLDWWSWDPIKELVSYRGTDGDLRDAVRHGLVYWKRRVLTGGTGRQFLGTLVCEGGLPLRLVQDEGAHLRRYFRELLGEHETYPTLDLMHLALRLRSLLPARMQNAVVYELATDLTRQVAEMRRQNVTEQQAAAWPIPLRLDAAVAREFLEGLRTAPVARHRREPGITIRTILRLGAERILQREIVLPPKLTSGWLEQAFAQPELPSRFNLSLDVADGSRLAVGIATRQDQNFLVRSTARPLIHPTVAAGQVRLIASYSGKDVGAFVPLGGTALPRTPWIFSGDTEEFSLLSTSSIRSKSHSLLVGIPCDGDFDVDGSIEELGDILGHKRRLIRLQGHLIWCGDGDEVQVSTDHAEEEGIEFELRGQRPPALVRDADAWLGCPEVWALSSNGVPLRVARSSLEWRNIDQGSLWRRIDGSTIGVGHIALRQDSGGFRALARILPADFRVNLRCGKSGRGIVELRSGSLLAAGTHAPAGVNATVRSAQGGFDVEMHAVDAAAIPASTLVSLRLEGNVEISIMLPYPAERVAFVGSAGNALSQGHNVSLDELAQIRAVVVSPEATDWAVDVREPFGSIRLATLRFQGDGLHELHMEPLRGALASILASDPDLDRAVEVRIVREGPFSGSEPRLFVRRYDLALRPLSGDGTHRVDVPPADANRLGPATMAAIHAEAVALTWPDRPAILLPRDSPGVWSLDEIKLVPGPWLVLAFQNDYLRGRPLRITIPGPATKGLTTELERAILLEDRDTRQERIREVIRGLAEDLRSPERDVLRAQLCMLGRCPAGTFDVIRGVAENPLVAVQLLLEAGPRQALLWNGLEELPFLWAAVPVSAWLRAVVSHVEHLRTALPAGLDVEGIVETAAPGVFGPTKLAPFLNSIHDAAFLVSKGIREPRERWVFQMRHHRIPAQFLAHLDEEVNALLLRHADEKWWPPSFPFIDTDVDRYRDQIGSLITRFPDGPGFREPVLMTPMVLAAQMLDASSNMNLLRLRRIRAFDPDWFEFAHAFALSFLLGRRYDKKEAPFQ